MLNGKFRLVLLAFLTVFVLSLSIGPIHLVSALSPVSTLYLTPNATGPLTIGASLVVNITGDQLGASAFSGINGWDIVIQDNDPSALNLNPISISIAGNLLASLGTVSEQINCVDGGAGFTLGQPGNIGCDIRDGPGIVHTAAVLQGPAGPTPISGLVAKVVYTVNGAGEDLLNVLSPCPSAQGCDTLTDGTPIPVPHITRGADTQTPNNDFVLTTTNPAATNPGSSVSGTVNIASLNTYSAAIAFTTDTFPGTGLTPACSAISPRPVAPGGTASATCTFNSIIPGIYVVTVNATDGTLFHLAPFTVKVGDFALGTPLAAVGLVTTNTGSAAISLSSINGFSGTVAVSSTVTPVTGLIVTCSPSLTATPTIPGSGSCALSSSTPGTYSVRVNGTYAFTGGKITHINSFNVNVQDFAITTTSTQPVVMASGATNAAAQVRLAALFGWNKQVVLTTTTDVPGLTANCGAAVVPTAAGVLRTCTLTSTTPGAYTLTVTATCGTAQGCTVAVARLTTVTIRVQDISIQYTGVTQPITFVSGGTNSTTFTVSSLPANSAGFAGTANIATTISPLTGLSPTCPTTVTLTAGATSPQQTCTFNSSTPNTYTVTLNATALITTGQTVKHTITITVIVKPAVVSHTTTTVILCHPTTIAVNNSTSCTISVTDTATGPTTPTGILTLTSSGIGSFSTCTLAGTGATATCDTTYLPTVIGTGSHLLTASYGGDSTHGTSSGPTTITVTVRTTTTTVSCHPTTIVVNNSTSCTVRVSDTSPGTAITPFGIIGLTSSGTGTFTTCTLGGTGATATCSTTYTPTVVGTGSHQLTASYAGDTNHSAAATANTTITVTVRTTSTTISCHPITIVVNNSTSCTVTVTDTSPGTASTPTGTITLATSGTGTFSTCTFTAGSCTVTYTPTVIGTGTHTLTATYNGDLTHGTSQATAGITVTQRGTISSVVCTPSPVAVTSSATCTATVQDTSPGTAITPSGTVAFSSNSTVGSFTFTGSPCNLSGTGATATCQVTYGTSGTTARHDLITDTYSGDTSHTTSQGTFTLAISAQAVHATATTISCHPTMIVVNNATSCTATVTDIATTSPTTPTGTVTFTSNGAGTFTGTCTLTGVISSASCIMTVTYTPTAIGTGTQAITGTYNGDATHSSSQGATGLTINKRVTSTTVNCSPANVVINQPSTCTVTVADTSTAGTPITPGGTVTFASTGGAGLFSSTTCTLIGGQCSVSFTPSTTTVSNISAIYGGDANHSGSSTATAATVTGSPPSQKDFTLSVSPTSITLVGDSPERAIVTLHSNGFNGTVDVSVKISPTGQGLAAHLVRIRVPLGPTSTQKIVLLVSGDEANAGDYTITVTGTSGSLSHSASLKVTVIHPGDDQGGFFGQFFGWFLLQVSTSRWD